jgi:hypothetical protein
MLGSVDDGDGGAGSVVAGLFVRVRRGFGAAGSAGSVTFDRGVARFAIRVCSPHSKILPIRADESMNTDQWDAYPVRPVVQLIAELA